MKLALNKKEYLIVLPALTAFFMALIPTLSYSHPLSWDIYYHIHLSRLYLEQGLIFWDPLTYAPFGRPIFYPPLFHFVLLIPNSIGFSPLESARILQPLLSFSLIFCFTYLVWKWYGLRVAIIASLIFMYSSAFHRTLLPIPETMALIFLILSLYFYHNSIVIDDLKSAVLSGIIGGLCLITHPLTALVLILILFLYSLISRYKDHNFSWNKWWLFLLFLLLLAGLWWAPVLSYYGFVFNNPRPSSINLIEFGKIFLKTFGFPVLMLVPLGAYYMYKRQFKVDIFLFAWFFLFVFISLSYFCGVRILIDRILNFAVFPLVIIAAVGVEYLRKAYKNLYNALIIILLAGALLSGIFIAFTIQPLVTDSQLDVANWLDAHAHDDKVVICLTKGLDPVIVAISRHPVATGGYQPGMVQMLDLNKYYDHNYTLQDLIQANVGYIIIEKNMGTPPYTRIVYENEYYKICGVIRN